MAEEYTECLLENKYHDNCPGCKVYQMKTLRRGFPFSELCSVWIIVLCTALPISSLFPFLYFMELSQRGAANGIAMTAMSLFKIVGPADAGILFSWSERRLKAAFIPGPPMVFFVLNVLVVVGVALTFKPFLTAARR